MQEIDDERLRAVMRYEFAAIRLTRALGRFEPELKFRPDQLRVPAGSGRESGRFADEGRHTSKRGGGSGNRALREGARRVAGLVAANPEAAAAVAASAAAPAAVGGAALAHVNGLAARYMGGQTVTPFLGIPYDPTEGPTGAGRIAGVRGDPQTVGRAEIEANEEACDDLFSADRRRCEAYARKHGSSKPGRYSTSAIKAICFAQASIRLSQCRRGGRDSVSAPLFTGGER